MKIPSYHLLYFRESNLTSNQLVVTNELCDQKNILEKYWLVDMFKTESWNLKIHVLEAVL